MDSKIEVELSVFKRQGHSKNLKFVDRTKTIFPKGDTGILCHLKAYSFAKEQLDEFYKRPENSEGKGRLDIRIMNVVLPASNPKGYCIFNSKSKRSGQYLLERIEHCHRIAARQAEYKRLSEPNSNMQSSNL